MYSFSGATCTSRVPHNASYVPYAQIRFDQSGYTPIFVVDVILAPFRWRRMVESMC